MRGRSKRQTVKINKRHLTISSTKRLNPFSSSLPNLIRKSKTAKNSTRKSFKSNKAVRKISSPLSRNLPIKSIAKINKSMS
jgi:hypothetical protein